MRDRVLLWLANAVLRRPWAIVLGAVALAIVAGGYAALTLRLNASTDDLISPNRPFMQDYRRFLDEFGDLEYLHAVVETSHEGGAVAVARAEAAVDALAQRLRAIEDLSGVYSAIEPDEQLRLATRSIPEDELAGLATAAGAFPSLLTGDADRVIHDGSELLKTLIRTGSKMSEAEQEHVGAAAVILMNVIAAAKEGSEAARETAFLADPSALKPVHVTSDSGKFYFISIASKKDFSTLSVLAEPLRRIREAIELTQKEFPEVNIGLTGKPVLQADELMTSNTDMMRASILAFVLCAALFMWSFGGVWKPMLAVGAFACATAWTYGFAAITVGQLNLLSIVFMLVLIGVGLDYGVHMLARYREHMADADRHEAIARSVVTAGRGNLTGAATSSAVFFMAYFTTFQGLRELGLIAGGGLLLCVAAMTVVLPALLMIFDGKNPTAINPKSKIQNPKSSGSLIFVWLHNHPAAVLISAAAITLGLVLAPGSWRFEQNLLNLQAKGLNSVEWEHRILEDSAAASWFGAVICNDQPAVTNTIARARQQPTIGAIESVFDVIQPQTDRRERLRQQLHQQQSLSVSAEDGSNATVHPWTIDDLNNAAGSLNTIAGGAARRAPEEARRMKAISDDLRALAAEMKRGASEAAAVRSRIDAIVKQVSYSLGLILEGDQRDLRSALPEAVRNRCVSPSGKYLVMLHPKNDVWEYEPMRQFIADMREVDPHVTGVPITHFESLADMRESFIRIAILSLLVIAALVWLDFRDWRDALLAVAPTVIGMVWLFETMAMFDISFNLANFFSVPILIGLSVDGSVHMLHRYREGESSPSQMGATRRAVIVTALTTIIGFGCVMLAHHRGLRSLGQVMALGSGACLLATVILLPALLAMMERRRKMPAKDSPQRS